MGQNPSRRWLIELPRRVEFDEWLHCSQWAPTLSGDAWPCYHCECYSDYDWSWVERHTWCVFHSQQVGAPKSPCCSSSSLYDIWQELRLVAGCLLWLENHRKQINEDKLKLENDGTRLLTDCSMSISACGVSVVWFRHVEERGLSSCQVSFIRHQPGCATYSLIDMGSLQDKWKAALRFSKSNL